ncbi:putative UPF0481 protein At3g02645 [Lolium perenne]|uniref:putative UPF0481 protein At3g02645 n=1 Tax=Lolium perenne TaxID=4522 RepID=UPI0021F6555C|nr:putative UPF0481 protein At3g02645 [Lolium perenne]
MATCSSHPFDETQWIIRIRRILDEEIELCDDQPISIFDVLKPLMCTKPEAYVPQMVALGPYHHCHEGLRDMEMYKLSAAKRAQSHLPSMNFQRLVDVFATLEHLIRSHYHRQLTLTNETLAWMMAIDVSFLLEFLQTFSQTSNKQRRLQRMPSRMSHLVDHSRRTSTHSMLLRDIVMLENQIPMFLLVKAMEMRCPSAGPDVLGSMLSGFFQEVSTLKGVGSPCTDATRHAHLLDFLYSNMVPCGCVEESDGAVDEAGDGPHDQAQRSTLSSVAELVMKRGLKLASLVTDFVVRVLLKFVASLPCLSMLRQPIEEMTSQRIITQRGSPEPSGGSDVQSKNASPLLEEIAVPTVAELAYAGVTFVPAVGGVSAIEFCARTATLHLPVISVDMTTEVTLRNLVAYEASVGSRALVLARYVELMNGIIDTDEDARLLRERGIILNHLKSDQEVAELWNGMTRSVRLTRVPALDKVIDELNRYHGSCWKVRVRAFVRARLLGSRDLVACALMLFLFVFVALQALCISRGCLLSWYGMGMARRKDACHILKS